MRSAETIVESTVRFSSACDATGVNLPIVYEASNKQQNDSSSGRQQKYTWNVSLLCSKYRSNVSLLSIIHTTEAVQQHIHQPRGRVRQRLHAQAVPSLTKLSWSSWRYHRVYQHSKVVKGTSMVRWRRQCNYIMRDNDRHDSVLYLFPDILWQWDLRFSV